MVAAVSLQARIFEGRFSKSFPVCAFFLRLFFKWRSAGDHEFHCLGQEQSTVAQQAETTLEKVFPEFPDQLLVSLFP